MKRRLAVILALAMMFGAMAALSGPALGEPQGNNGNHNGSYAHENSGMHIGQLEGGGKINNLGLNSERRGLR